MKYIYTKPMCGACADLKHAYDIQGVKYVERPAERLEEPEDEIDHAAFLHVVMAGEDIKNMTLPVEFDVKGDNNENK